jgi:hypothetical protein
MTETYHNQWLVITVALVLVAWILVARHRRLAAECERLRLEARTIAWGSLLRIRDDIRELSNAMHCNPEKFDGGDIVESLMRATRGMGAMRAHMPTLDKMGVADEINRELARLESVLNNHSSWIPKAFEDNFKEKQAATAKKENET